MLVTVDVTIPDCFVDTNMHFCHETLLSEALNLNLFCFAAFSQSQQAKAGSGRIDDELSAATTLNQGKSSKLTDPASSIGSTAEQGDKTLVELLPATEEDIKHTDHEVLSNIALVPNSVKHGRFEPLVTQSQGDISTEPEFQAHTHEPRCRYRELWFCVIACHLVWGFI